MKLLLLGLGYWGKNWAKTLNQLGALGGICDSRPEVAKLIAKEYPGVPFYEDLNVALAQPELDAVVLVTPVSSHYRLAQQCLLAGKSVLVEKPLTLSPEESRSLVYLAKEQGLKLAVGHILMYHPALMKLKELVQSGELGDILSVQCTRVNLGKIRNEENVWWSLAPHDLSIISLILEEPLSLVTASQMNLLGRPNLMDSVTAQYKTPSGRDASIHVSWFAPIKKHETIVVGTRKIAVFEDTQPPEQKIMLVEYQLDREGDWVNSIEKGDVTYVPYDNTVQPLAGEAVSFIEALKTGGPLSNDGQNGYEVVHGLDAVQQWLDAAATRQPQFAEMGQ